MFQYFVREKLKEVDSNVFLVLNKVDRIKKENLFPMIEEYNKLFDFKEIIPISALKKDNIDDLIKTIKNYLDEFEYYSGEYPQSLENWKEEDELESDTNIYISPSGDKLRIICKYGTNY